MEIEIFNLILINSTNLQGNSEMRIVLTLICTFWAFHLFAQRFVVDNTATRTLYGNESLKTVADISTWSIIKEENELVIVWDYDELTFEVIAKTHTYKYTLIKLVDHYSNGLDRETGSWDAIDSENQKCTIHLLLQKEDDKDIICNTILYPNGFSSEFIAMYESGQVKIGPKTAQ